MPQYPPQARTCVAFDGSLNAHWVARYAMRMAIAEGRELDLIHVTDGAIVKPLFEERVAHLLRECSDAGIATRRHELHSRGDVARAVLDATPGGRDSLLLCGTRTRQHGRGLLAGSVAERLLRAGHCAVLSLRVLTPGLLGCADRLLLPMAGWPGEARDALPVLHPLLAAAAQLHLLRVMEADTRTIDHAPREALARLRAHGRASVTDSERELRAALHLDSTHVDAHVRLDENWAHAAAVVARSYDCNLLLAAGSDRQLGVARTGTAPVERLLVTAPCDVGIYSVCP